MHDGSKEARSLFRWGEGKKAELHFRVALEEEVAGPLLVEENHLLIQWITAEARAGGKSVGFKWRGGLMDPAHQAPGGRFKARVGIVFRFKAVLHHFKLERPNR